MRAIWSGALSFGLVNIPIKLYSATSGKTLSFDMLHKKDLSPIRYARVCRVDGKEIPYEDIVKGYEYQKGDYVVLTDEDFKKANVKKTKAIEIQDFVKENEIDPIYFEKPYYLEPEKGAAKAYVLLREALKKSKKIGIAKFVLRNREHLAVIKPFGNVLLLNQMRYQDEIRRPDDLNLPETKEAGKREIEIALALIDQLTSHFKPEEYHDTYTEELERVIKAKAKGKPIKAKGKEPQPTEVTDLMAMLRASLEKEKAKA
ncbi:MAG: Ku protein [Candidatus Doudnabacteria bacterium]|nr:Ku protein [Candidatus Doudnabacteria bacterium]